MYCRVPQNRWKDLEVDSMAAKSLIADRHLSKISSSLFSTVDFDEWQKAQKNFFNRIDAGSEFVRTSEEVQDNLETDEDVLTDDDMAPSLETCKQPGPVLSPAAQARKDALQRGKDSMAMELASLKERETSIVKAAFRALDTGLFTIPNSGGTWNPGQCVGFLLHAYQLQMHYNESHASEKNSLPDAERDSMRFCCIFTGAAGTGKTALLEACDLLTEAVYQSTTCVYRSAPTRTAARLNRGNTCHAAWHLPFGCSLGFEGRMSDATLSKLRKKVVGVFEASIDEISMLGPQKFYQIDSRAKSATNVLHLIMGGLKLRLSGDFLQLPPVKAGSFAGPVMEEDVGDDKENKRPRVGRPTATAKTCARSDRTVKRDNEDIDDEYDDEEGNCGLETFRRISDVVCLTKVVRAPNALGALCTCIRERRITDNVWALLQSLVIQPGDERLNKRPFSASPCKIIVQRHVLRSAMSNEAVLAQAPKMSSPVYLVTARDDVETADDAIRSEVQRLLQNEHTLRKTAHKPSLLLLYEGARMLLEGKDCRLLGLMNGAEVVVEKIILNESEAWTEPREIHPNVTQLKYMPAAVVVRVPEAQWILPTELLGPLKGKVLPKDLRGIFIVRPDTTRPFKVALNGIKWRVKRTQLNLIPANSIIVYGAQGESFDSAIVDLGMPPGQSPQLFWLACYVMLTRCKELDGLLILRLPPRSALEVGPPGNVQAEMDRLKKLAVQTTQRLIKNLRQTMQDDIPDNIASLFSCTQAITTEVDWPHVDALLAEEVAARQLQSASPGKASDSAPTPSKTGPRRGPLKRGSAKVASVPDSPGQGESTKRRRITGKRADASFASAAHAASHEATAATVPFSPVPPPAPSSTTLAGAATQVTRRRGPLKRRTGQPSSMAPDSDVIGTPRDACSAPVPVEVDTPSHEVPVPSVPSAPISPEGASAIVSDVVAAERSTRRGPLKRRTGQPSSTSHDAVAVETKHDVSHESVESDTTHAVVVATPPTTGTASVQNLDGMPYCVGTSAADVTKRDLCASAASHRIEREAARGIGDLAKAQAMKRRSEIAMKQEELERLHTWRTTPSVSSSATLQNAKNVPSRDPASALSSPSSSSMPSVRELEFTSHLSEAPADTQLHVHVSGGPSSVSPTPSQSSCVLASATTHLTLPDRPTSEPSVSEQAMQVPGSGSTAEPSVSDHPTPDAGSVCCDKCDGPHATDQCPHFKFDKEKHKDAWENRGRHLASHDRGATSDVVVIPQAQEIRKPGDGSCLYHALNFGLNQLGRQHGTAAELRRDLADFLRDHPTLQISGDTLDEWVRWDQQCTLPVYARRQRVSGWGGGIEMACFAQKYDVHVHVYKKVPNIGYKRLSIFHAPSTNAPKIDVIYQGDVHYDALVIPV